MDFSLTPELKSLQLEVRAFIAEHIIPLEKDARQTSHGPSESLREELVGLARKAGLLTPPRGPWRSVAMAGATPRPSSATPPWRWNGQRSIER